MTIYEFVEVSIQTMGGVFVPLEYALCSVLIPQQYQENFQGRSEILLAFDYEVAQENPDSEFVTYGSYIFDVIFQIARTTAQTTQRYAVVDRLEFHNASEKIKKYLQMDAGKVNIISETSGMALLGCYTFSIQYIADERAEETQTICINLITGEIYKDMVISHIFYETQKPTPTSNLSYFKNMDMHAAYLKAYEEVQTISLNNGIVLADENQINVEVARIENYYNEIIEENRKRANRKAISAERLTDYAEKEKALILEKKKQMNEMKEKFTIKTVIALENIIVYHIPFLKFLCQVDYMRNSSKQIFYFDPIFKRIIDGEPYQ